MSSKAITEKKEGQVPAPRWHVAREVAPSVMTAEQPLLLTSLQGDPNSSVSFSYIPGSVVRGALIGG